MAGGPRKIAALALLAALAGGTAGCAALGGAGDAPESWQAWTSNPRPGQDAPALAQVRIEASALKGSNAAWLERWTRPPVSLVWTDATLELVVKYQQNPLRAARALALVHVAMHDALVLAARAGASTRARAIAVHRAASLTLAHVYPNEAPGRLEAMGLAGAVAVALLHRMDDDEFARAYNAGSGAAQATIQRALADGSGRVWPVRLRPADKPGQWRAAPPLNLYDPTEAFAGEWRTWVLKDGGEIQPPPPVAFDTPEFWKEAEQVLAATRALTPEQKRIAEDWNLGQGSVTPPGVWNRRARELVIAQRMDDAHTMRLFAALNVAMMDAFIACWRAKFTWWTVRPVNVIRDRFDASYLPHLVTPPFPSYISGHSSVSGAAAGVLRVFFPGQSGAFDEQAQEAAYSRLLGGIHYQSDNDEGLRLGYRVAARVIERIGLGAAAQRASGTSTR